MNLKDKVVIVTGAASGIGLASARRFAQEGARVVVTDRDDAGARAAAADIGGTATGIGIDVSNSSVVNAVVGDVFGRFGRVDVLVNNAGYGITGSVVETDEAEWDRLMATNLKGVFLCSKAVIPLMARAGGGSIVNTGSYTVAAAIADRAAYVASKGGIVALTRAMALDHVDQGIRVNAVAPGTIASSYFDAMFARSDDPAALRRKLDARAPMNRMGRPEEIANMIVWLASDEASFATGGVFTVDGGTSVW